MFNGDFMSKKPPKSLYDLSCSKNRKSGTFSIPDQILVGSEPSVSPKCSSDLKTSNFVHSRSVEALGNYLESTVDLADLELSYNSQTVNKNIVSSLLGGSGTFRKENEANSDQFPYSLQLS